MDDLRVDPRIMPMSWRGARGPMGMRKLVVTENVSLDGVVDLSGGWFDPLAAGPDLVAATAEHREAADALLVGRTTFEAFRGFWPERANDPTGNADYLDRVAKYVVSRTLAEPGWANTTVLRGDVVPEVQALKAAEGRDIVATGSIRLVRSLIAAGLVDEYRLFVFPVVAGTGARLFERARLSLRLLEARRFEGGAVLLRYAATAEPLP